MKNPLLLMICATFALGGCAEQILSNEETLVIGPDAATQLSVAPRNRDKSLLAEASQLAEQLASAYFSAGIKAAQAQDVLNLGVYIAAGSVAAGALGSASNRVLTNRAMAGVGLQSIGQNGLKKTEVQSLFTGATKLNCISSIASIYSISATGLAHDKIAQDLTFSAMEQVRISARNVLVRDVETFSTVLQSFTDVAQTGGTEASLRETGSGVSVAELDAYAAKLGACVSNKTEGGED